MATCETCGVEFEPDRVGRRFCSRSCASRFSHPPSTPGSFWARIKITEGCWLWTGPTQDGYGRLTYRYRHVGAHRLAWELTNGPIPKGLCICHHCDVRACCNPEHLFLGSIADNVADRDAKGRRGDERGERNGSSKLTDHQVREIRQLIAAGRFHTSIAAAYGVSHTTIRDIATGDTWAWLK